MLNDLGYRAQKLEISLLSFIHPIRTYEPCSGVGRHANNMLLRLAERQEIDLTLLFSEQWLDEEGAMDARTPLRSLPHHTFPWSENKAERLWKLLGWPSADRFIPPETDIIYAPVETYLPVTTCPVTITIHDIQAFETDLPWSQTWQHRWFRLKWSTWIHKALRDCARVFTVSQFSKRRMVALLDADPDKIVVVGNGVDTAFFEMASSKPGQLDRPCPEPYLFMIGGLRQKKGGDALLAVARELQQQGSPIQLVVAGPNSTEHEEKVASLDNVHLLGWVPDADVPRLMRTSLALLFLPPYEGFGMPAAEAMAAGTPAIVSNAASLPEVVGDAGIIVDPSDTEVIVDWVLQLERDSTLRQSYTAAGQARVEHYTWDRCVDRVVKTLHEVVG